MSSTGDLWEALGALEEEDAPHVLTRLFTMYEERLGRNPDDEEARLFFRNLETVVGQVSQCNLNRR